MSDGKRAKENERIRNKIVDMYREFVAKVDPKNVLDLLIQKRIISVREKLQVMKTDNTKDCCRALLDHLLCNPQEETFIVLRDALGEHYPSIVEFIDSTDTGDETTNRFRPMDADITMRHLKLQKEKLLEIIDSEFGLLNKLLKNLALSNAEIDQIKAEKTLFRKNDLLLDTIVKNGRLPDLIVALAESSQTHVINWIKANGERKFEYGMEWPLTEREHRFLDQNQDALVEILDTCDLTNRLYSAEVINSWHKEFVELKSIRHERNEALLHLIRRFSLKAYAEFIKCLRKSNQAHIAETFESGAAIIEAHATLESDNLDEAETQIVDRMAQDLCARTTSVEQANRCIAALQLKVIAVKRGDSIVLYISCCKEEELNFLCEIVENKAINEILEQLFNSFVHKMTVKVLLVKLLERDIAKAREFYAQGVKVTSGLEESSDNGTMKQLRSFSECCICLMTYTDPRTLPCLHTFCLKCLEDIHSKNEQKQKQVFPCPSCNKEFTIPPEGMKFIPKNFLFENLMEVKTTAYLKDKTTPCTVCSKIDEASESNEATMRCLNCCESYCLRCSKIHGILKLTKDHKLVEINSKRDSNETAIGNMFSIRSCRERHPSEVFDYHCSDCKTVFCASCHVVDHQTHKCNEVERVHEKFRQVLKEYSGKMSAFAEHFLSKKMDAERQRREFLEKTRETEKTIRSKIQQLRPLIDQHARDVLSEFFKLKQKHHRRFDQEIQEIQRRFTDLESFNAYCIELRSKGSPSEVCDCVDSLIAKAEEINEENEQYLSNPSKAVEIEFMASFPNALLENIGNVIGKLSESTKRFESCIIVIGVSDDNTISRDVIKINLNRQEDISKLQQIPTQMKLESAATAYCNSLFVTGIGKECDEIWRFDANCSDWMKCASLVQGRRRHSATFIECRLYICGGYLDSSESVLDSVEAYDTLNNRCVTAGTLAYAVQNSGNGVAFKASIYIFGGLGRDDEIVNTVQVYDTMLNTCSLLSKRLPVPKFNLRAAMWENSVILIGHNGCFKYDFDTDALEARNQFKTGVAHFGLTVHNGNIFIIGGGNWMAGAYGGIKWVNRNDVRFIPVANFLKGESTEWKLYAKFPKPSLVFAHGKIEFLL